LRTVRRAVARPSGPGRPVNVETLHPAEIKHAICVRSFHGMRSFHVLGACGTAAPRTPGLCGWSSVAWLDPLSGVAQPVRRPLVVVLGDAQAVALPAAGPAQREEAGGAGRGQRAGEVRLPLGPAGTRARRHPAASLRAPGIDARGLAQRQALRRTPARQAAHDLAPGPWLGRGIRTVKARGWTVTVSECPAATSSPSTSRGSSVHALTSIFRARNRSSIRS